VEKSLVVADHRGAQRYRLVDSVRGYALDNLDASGERSRLDERGARWTALFAEQWPADAIPIFA
jgi:predicted ATPase